MKPDEIPAEVVAAAQQADYEDRSHNWHRVPDWQVRRLIAGAVAAERERIYAELGNDHYVIFTEDRWTVEHSVECRLSGQMHECAWHAAVVRIAGEFEADMVGRWLITAIDGNGEPALVRDALIREQS